ncbi:RNA deprotection pyrophosphohydrolase [Bacillus sp. FSL K6-3431]|uniref:RNA deprotection pyrophosphohydrolase n=1 Tax=Bacillus sp. FSL K6-3431 TaxID=2921500 RepID=UPI0030F5A46A
MREFYDVNNNKVFLAFKRSSFPMDARHVFVISRYREKWLLTNHAQRGLEFPGGKREVGETIEEAARREVSEETGGIIKTLVYIGEYLVEDKHLGHFVKAIYFAEMTALQKKEGYLETSGPVLVEGNIISKVNSPEYSFIMKDEIVPAAIAKIIELGLL